MEGRVGQVVSQRTDQSALKVSVVTLGSLPRAPLILEWTCPNSCVSSSTGLVCIWPSPLTLLVEETWHNHVSGQDLLVLILPSHLLSMGFFK